MRTWWPHFGVAAAVILVIFFAAWRSNSNIHPTQAMANPTSIASQPSEEIWLKTVQMPAAMRQGMGVPFGQPPRGGKLESLALLTAGDCQGPAPARDPISPLRTMRCQYSGKGAPPKGDPVVGLSADQDAELSTYFNTRLHLAACAADACDRLVLDALKSLKSGPVREGLVSRWVARTGQKSGPRANQILNAFFAGDVPDSPEPNMMPVLDRLDNVSVLSPRAALGLLRYAERPMSATLRASATYRAATGINEVPLAYEARFFAVANSPASAIGDQALTSLAQGGAPARSWYAKALYRKCRGRYYAKSYDSTIACYRILEGLNTEERDLSIWFQGISYWKLGKKQEAIITWKRLWDQGRDETGGESAYLAGKHYFLSGNKTKAVELTNMAMAKFPYATYTGDLLALTTNGQDSPDRLSNLFRRTPHSLGTAGLLERRGMEGAGHLAFKNLPAWMPSSDTHWSAMLLMLAGEPQAAMSVVRLSEPNLEVRKWQPESRLIWAWGQSELGNYLAGIKTIELLWFEKGYDELARTRPFMATLYPLYYLPQAKAASDEMGIPVPYLYGIMRQESRFMHKIRSRSGAIGLSQIMPTTGAAIAKWLGEADSYTPPSLDNPAKNVRYGARYLAYLKEKFGPDPRLMAGGYNGGPGNVGRWLAKNSYARPWAWVEAMHLDETRDYVKKVVHNAWTYKHLYPEFPCEGRLCKVELD